jgi:NADH-quinone oxidoreductase subunit G
MAAVAGKTVNITINDIDIAVPDGELIVESVKRLGLEIPIFCYHPRMTPVGMCRMCLVELGFRQPDGSVRKMPKPQAGCTLPASEGMVIYTDSEMVHRDRKGVLEFLLINHPLDCPICDRGGECPLQNNTLFYGPSTSRFTEIKRHLPKAFPLSGYVTLDLERCIQCGRCVRFTEEISGDAQLAFRFRGANMQPSTFELTDFESKFSGNVIEICPVGALTNTQYRFRARPWDLQTKPAICTLCSNGCNIWFDYRVGTMVRINGRTNEPVNEEWTCDRGKFGHDFYNDPKRLRVPMIRRGERLEQAEWSEAYSLILEAFAPGGNRVAALGGATCSNEDVFLLQRLFRRQFKSNNLDHRFERTLPTAEQRLENTMGRGSLDNSIRSLQGQRGIFIFGSSLADEEPIVFLRVRKAWFRNAAKVVVASAEPTDADSFAHLILRYKPGTERTLANGILAAAIAEAGLPASDAVKASLEGFTLEFVAAETGVRASDIAEAAMILAGTNAATITTRSIWNTEHALDTVNALASLATLIAGGFNLYGLQANDQGCEDLGILPDQLPGCAVIAEGERGLGTHGILEGCANGSIEALWLVNVDPFEAHPDRDLVTRALENVPFLVYQGILETEALHYASVVLPMAAPAETDGSFTNVERRVQRMPQILALKGSAKPAWRIFSEVMLRAQPGRPFFNPREVMEEIGREVPWYSAAAYDHLDAEGAPVTPGMEFESLPQPTLNTPPAEA